LFSHNHLLIYQGIVGGLIALIADDDQEQEQQQDS
jgi:hypothetical protein